MYSKYAAKNFAQVIFIRTKFLYKYIYSEICVVGRNNLRPIKYENYLREKIPMISGFIY